MRKRRQRFGSWMSVLGLAAVALAGPAAAFHQVSGSVLAGPAFGIPDQDSFQWVDGALDDAAQAEADDGFGNFGEAEASASISTGVVSTNVLGEGGGGAADAEFEDEIQFSLPAGMTEAIVAFTANVSGGITADCLGPIQADVFGTMGVSVGQPVGTPSNAFSTGCGFGTLPDPFPSQFVVTVRVVDGSFGSVRLFADISGSAEFGSPTQTMVNLTIGRLLIAAPPGVSVTSASGALPIPEPGIGLSLLAGGMAIGILHRRKRGR